MYICELLISLVLKTIVMEKSTTALSAQEQLENPQELNVNDTQAQETLDEITNENIGEESANKEDDTPNYSLLSLKEIIQIFEDMLERGDQQELYKHSDLIKSSFYKVLKREKIESGMYENALEGAVADVVEETPDNNTEEKESASEVANDETQLEEAPVTIEVQLELKSGATNPFIELERGFKELYSRYREGRQAFIQNLEKTKEDNLAKKLEIIEELKVLLDKAEDVNHTFPAFRELQNRWKSISNIVPQAKSKDLWESYQHCVEKFYDYIKINNEFRDLDFKKNLEAKTELCEKAEALENESNIVTAFKQLQNLHEEWKEIGPVAKDSREDVWNRFKVATSLINKKHQGFFETLKEDQKNNLAAKTELCEQAEEIANSAAETSSDWNSLSKQMETLQTKWKTIGFASKKDNQKIYDRFREACDKFYNAKRDYYAGFKNVMQTNLKKKEELCEQAEALMNSDDWKKSTDQLINLQKVWKEVGPVARKQSDIVWKRFRAACDMFFERKSKHFDNVDSQYSDNLTAKLALVEEIKAYKLSDSKEENIKAMRSFSDKWNEIGFVPFKEKERVQKLFNGAMDAHFADIRSIDGEKRLNKFKKMVIESRNSGKSDRGLRFEREKLVNKYKKIENDIATLENNMGFFAKSKNADAFIVEIEKKISIAREELVQIEEKIKIIDKQFE